MSVPIIVDEWLFEDLTGNGGREKQIQAILFLNKLYDVCDQIVILEGSSFETKMHTLMKSNNDSPTFISAKRTFIDLIERNSNKKYYITQNELTDLPEAFIPLINDPPDHFLFQCHLKLMNKGCFILTTDGRWKEEKLKKKGFRIEKRDSFIPKYLKHEVSC